jgi:hypothetical protein
MECLFPLRMAELHPMPALDEGRPAVAAYRWQCPNKACQNYRNVVDVGPAILPAYGIPTPDLPLSVYPTLGHIASRFAGWDMLVAGDYHYSEHPWTYQVTLTLQDRTAWFTYLPFGRDSGIFETHHVWEDLDLGAISALCPKRPGLYVEVAEPSSSTSHNPAQVWCGKTSMVWKTYDGQSIPYQQLPDVLLISIIRRFQFTAVKQSKRDLVSSSSLPNGDLPPITDLGNQPAPGWSDYTPEVYTRLLAVAESRGIDISSWSSSARVDLMEAASLACCYQQHFRDRKHSTSVFSRQMRPTLVKSPR